MTLWPANNVTTSDELPLNLGDGVNQPANLASGMTSIPSRNLTPLMTFGNWFRPCSLRQVFDAAITNLKTIKRPVSCDNAPFIRFRGSAGSGFR